MEDIDYFNIGGPPIPSYDYCEPKEITMTNHMINTNQLSTQIKKLAFQQAVKTTGYTLFDESQVTETSLDNTKLIVNNTSFYIFFSLFIILTILILILMFYQHLELAIGLQLIILFALILYTSSVLYRYSTISRMISSTNVLNQQIERNRIAYENSIAYQPQMILDVINVISH